MIRLGWREAYSLGPDRVGLYNGEHAGVADRRDLHVLRSGAAVVVMERRVRLSAELGVEVLPPSAVSSSVGRSGGQHHADHLTSMAAAVR